MLPHKTYPGDYLKLPNHRPPENQPPVERRFETDAIRKGLTTTRLKLSTLRKSDYFKMRCPTRIINQWVSLDQ